MPAKKGKSTNYLTYNGLRFYPVRSGYYKSAKGKWMHRYVWECERGSIPEGYEIHHIDGDRANNRIDNLECVASSVHHTNHGKKLDKEKLRQNLVNARPAATKWHKSAEGRDWHRKHYAEVTVPLRESKVTLVCETCGKAFECDPLCANRAHYCSNACKTKARFASGVDNETRTCVICGNEFVCNKYVKKQTCSRECSTELMRRTKLEAHRHRG